MGQWIGESEKEGRLAAQNEVQRLIAERAAHEAFRNEHVTEDAVKRFLEPFKVPMVDVQCDLESRGYRVKDMGYGYNGIALSDQEHYALIHRGSHPQAYGQAWTIDTPDGRLLDMLRLFPLVNEATHFSKGHYCFLSGRGELVKPTADKDKAIATLQNLIGAKIIEYFTTKVTRSEG